MNKLREYREKAGLSQKYVALTIGIKPSSVSLWESGNTFPSIDNLIKLADLYNVTVDELLGRSTARDEADYVGLTLDEKHVMRLYRDLSDAGKEALFGELLRLHATLHRGPTGEDRPLPDQNMA